MLQVSVVLLIIIGYIGLLFAVASYGDRQAARGRGRAMRGGHRSIYALSLAVYCTSWTFLGSVGLSSVSGFSFLTIYIGPILLFTIGRPLMARVIHLAKAERITSVADFVAARYGKSQMVAAVVTLIAVVGSIPYIALQLKAVSISVETLVAHLGTGSSGLALSGRVTPVGDVSLLVAVAMAAFAILFGTRHADATEHQEGMMLAIATESLVKLAAFLFVGLYVTFVMFGGAGPLIASIVSHPSVETVFGTAPDGGLWLSQVALSFIAALLLPRQFHVAVTENTDPAELKRASWLFPSYLIAINLFVAPVAAAGLIRFGSGVDADTFVLALPIAAGADSVALVAFAGALSAATAMVIVESVALSIMISNDFIFPLMLSQRGGMRRVARAAAGLADDPAHGHEAGRADDLGRADMGRRLLMVRRASIVGVVMLAYVYYRSVGEASALAQIGFLSFAAVAQIAPAFFGGMIWRRGTARGAMAGMVAGFCLWAYTLLLPNFVASGLLSPRFIENGPFDIWLLRPQALFSLAFDPFIHGVVWSLMVNLIVYVAVSLMRPPDVSERLQASTFVPSDLGPVPALRLWRTAVTVDDLKATIARYLGGERTRAAFESHEKSRGIRLAPQAAADAELLRFSERLLASAVGAASSRLVLSLLIKQRDPSAKRATKLLDDATAAIRYNRDLLQTALEQVHEGIGVFDEELRLTVWNRQFPKLLEVPGDRVEVGMELRTILRTIAERGDLDPDDPRGTDAVIEARLADVLSGRGTTLQRRLASVGRIVEIHSSPMPDGGAVLLMADMTDRVLAAEALARANETLERRVKERTAELQLLNDELKRAKAVADEANLGKTRFLAAASHDILQPLNAARLYASTLVERLGASPYAPLVENVEASLESVEEIISALLDISQLDAGALKPEFTTFRLEDIFATLRVEFEAIAHARGLKLVIVPTALWVRSDRRLVRRLLQNFISNAVKYTDRGGVVVGCRRHGGKVTVEVADSGIGIPDSKLEEVFKEFLRLDPGRSVKRKAQGLGLGLSIVERIARTLDLPLRVWSRPGHGSRFAVEFTIVTAPEAKAVVIPPSAPVAAVRGLDLICIDNEPRILDGMVALLTGWGHRVLAAASLEAAVAEAALNDLTPDVVLVDFHLDGTNGLDVIARLRERWGADLGAVLVTADRSAELRAQATALGIAIVNKPVKPAPLRAVLAARGGPRPATPAA